MDKIPYSPGFRKRFIHQFFSPPACNPAPGPIPPFVSERSPLPAPSPEPAKPPTEPALYAVIRIEELCCFGTGATPERAVQAAQRCLPQNKAIEILPEFPLLGRVEGAEGLYMARCTPALSKAVETRGGAAWLKFQVADDGTVDVQPDSSATDRFFEAVDRLRDQAAAEERGAYADATAAGPGQVRCGSSANPHLPP